MTPQELPVSQQLRDEVEKARQRWLGTGRAETPEQREALRLVQGDTLTHEQIGQVASAFSMSADHLLELTNTVHDAGSAGGPG